MKKDADPQIDARLDAYSATVQTSAIANALKRSAEKWSVYAAVTGAAMAMASNASASVIYSGVINQTGSIALGNVTGAGFEVGLGSYGVGPVVNLLGRAGLGFASIWPGFGKRLGETAWFRRKDIERVLAFSPTIRGEGPCCSHE